MRIPDRPLVDSFRRSRTRCEWCGKVAAVQAHHWHHRGLGDACRIDRRENLVLLCPWCHMREEAGQITRSDLLAVIAAREGLRQADICAAVETLAHLVPPRTSLSDIHGWPFERREFYRLVDSTGNPTLAGRMCGLVRKGATP